jgi:hypothetical protein
MTVTLPSMTAIGTVGVHPAADLRHPDDDTDAQSTAWKIFRPDCPSPLVPTPEWVRHPYQ